MIIDQLATDLMMIETQIKELKTRKEEIRKQLIGMVPVWEMNRSEDVPAELIGDTHRVDFSHKMNLVYKSDLLNAAMTPEQQAMFKVESWQKFVRPSLI
ncbi:MAG: hypothetical protein Tp1109DCM542121_14 [Prokaryotic dsDNA virus sp.]|nr:MAG: hypothetical protein Tp1109DCM542121_14 [Prokaryotic dsDNA virus sp.]|tara:strand:+ start:6419 stop:6715 length:297 start_codon:yes stop_codon:yes gene_type:complete